MFDACVFFFFVRAQAALSPPGRVQRDDKVAGAADAHVAGNTFLGQVQTAVRGGVSFFSFSFIMFFN